MAGTVLANHLEYTLVDAWERNVLKHKERTPYFDPEMTGAVQTNHLEHNFVNYQEKETSNRSMEHNNRLTLGG